MDDATSQLGKFCDVVACGKVAQSLDCENRAEMDIAYLDALSVRISNTQHVATDSEVWKV